MISSLPMQYILESTFARIFPVSPGDSHLHNLLQFAQFAYTVFAIFAFVRQLLYFDCLF